MFASVARTAQNDQIFRLFPAQPVSHVMNVERRVRSVVAASLAVVVGSDESSEPCSAPVHRMQVAAVSGRHAVFVGRSGQRLDRLFLSYYKYSMGRPRKEDRMSRLVQARLTDEQYDRLAEIAYEGYDGDFSKALRSSLTAGFIMLDLLNSPDPLAGFTELVSREPVDDDPEDDGFEG